MIDTLAQTFDDALAVEVGWAAGDKAQVRAFLDWLDRYRLADRPPRPTRHQDATSACGGGAEAVYWFDEGGHVAGWSTTGDAYRIPAADLTTMPDVGATYPDSDEKEEG